MKRTLTKPGNVAFHSISPGEATGLDNFQKKAMDTKTYLAVFWSVLDLRNHYLACFCERPMLRLIPQLLRSSEIQLFEGTAGVRGEIRS